MIQMRRLQSLPIAQLVQFVALALRILPTNGNSNTALFQGPTSQQFCHTARHARHSPQECIDRVKNMAKEGDRFWFGHQWRLNCANQYYPYADRHHEGGNSRMHLTSNRMNCANPQELQAFHSLGSRLFHVNTFTQDYLANLRIFPSMTFLLKPGSYRACDHDFLVDSTDLMAFQMEQTSATSKWAAEEIGLELETSPITKPLPPYQIRAPPRITWPELSSEMVTKNNSSPLYTLLMLDVGFGQLKYLVVDFPHFNQTIHHYEGVDNFRLHQPTPFALLVFAQPGGAQISEDVMDALTAKYHHESMGDGHNEKKPGAPFSLSSFMTETGMEDSLVGLNWALIDGDAYAIERQRLNGFVDNCYSLVREKLLRDRRWAFAESFSLEEMDSMLRVEMHQPGGSVHRACCREITLGEQVVIADPLFDKEVPSVAVLNPPKVTSLRPSLMDHGYHHHHHYQRVGNLRRHYMVPRDESRYTLVLTDPASKYLFWMVVDLSADALASGSYESEDSGGSSFVLVANYTPPIPQKRPRELHYAVFMLFRQQPAARLADFYNADHALRSKYCAAHCIYRSGFDMEQFKQFHRLRLSAISWLAVSYDFFEASRQIEIIRTTPAHLLAGVRRKDAKSHRYQGSAHRADTLVGIVGPAAKEERIAEICAMLELGDTRRSAMPNSAEQCDDQDLRSSGIRNPTATFVVPWVSLVVRVLCPLLLHQLPEY